MNEISQRTDKEVSPWHIQRLGDIEEAEYAYAADNQSRHLRDYWNVLAKRRRLLGVLFILVFGLTAYINFTATPLYTATAMLQIEPQNPTVTGLAEILSSKSDGSGQYDYYQTQFVLLRSRALAARVITSLQLAADADFRKYTVSDAVLGRLLSWVFLPVQYATFYGSRLFSSSTQPEKVARHGAKGAETEVAPFLVGRYLGYLRVMPVKNTRLVEVSFSTPDPRLSQKLANAHAAGFIRMNIDNRAALTDEAREFLDKKNAELRAKLERSEEALNRFRQTHGVVSLDKGENIVVDRLVALNSQLTIARAQRIEAESLFRTVANKKYQDLSQVMTQGSIPQLKANIAALEAEHARLSTIFKPDHPRLQELIEHIAAGRRNLSAEIANIVRGIESSFVAARAREQALEAEAKKQEQKALDLKHIGVQYSVLQEDVNINRTLYESVLKRLSETNVSNDLAISNIQITQRADMPLFASSPQTARNLMLGAIIGLVLGVGMAFLLDYLDTKMSTPEHVERAVSLNTLGVVPNVSGLGRIEGEWKEPKRSMLSNLKSLTTRHSTSRTVPPSEMLLTKFHPQSIFPESYRSIRTSLLFSRPERPPQVILLTSAAPGEGKTATSLNLSIALAQDGHRVLVIDGDLRKGCCHDRLGMTNHKGLSNILAGNLTLEESIQATSIENLSLLTCGVSPPSPADLLGSNRMKETLARLRERFDFIIIDTPPAVALADAALLSIMCDGVVLVFNGQKTTTPSARQLIARLDSVHAPILGVILNSVDLHNPEFGYYGQYRSYYSHDSQPIPDEGDTGISDTEIHPLKPKTEDVPFRNESERLNAKDSPQVLTGSQKILDARGANDSAAHSDPSSGLETVRAQLGVVIPDTSSPPTPGGDIIPEESLDRLIAAVAGSIGPLASQVVREQIVILGETCSAFPKSRIGELVKLVQREITRRTSIHQVHETATNPKI